MPEYMNMRVGEELFNRIEDQSRDEGIKRSTFVRKILQDYIDGKLVQKPQKGDNADPRLQNQIRLALIRLCEMGSELLNENHNCGEIIDNIISKMFSIANLEGTLDRLHFMPRKDREFNIRLVIDKLTEVTKTPRIIVTHMYFLFMVYWANVTSTSIFEPTSFTKHFEFMITEEYKATYD